jgi:AcrR family transcriptional regulator
MSRGTRTDWIAAGMSILTKQGHDALTIDALGRALGRTKGSFYHHFADAPEFHQAILRAWEDKSTSDLIAAADALPSSSDRRSQLYALVRTIPLALERAVQAWAIRDPKARRFRARVDKRRVAYLAELRRSAGVAKADAMRVAQIEYAVFVGAIQVFELERPANWRAFERANAFLLRALDAALER